MIQKSKEGKSVKNVTRAVRDNLNYNIESAKSNEVSVNISHQDNIDVNDEKNELVITIPQTVQESLPHVF